MGSRFIASRMRWRRCHAVRGVRPYLRSTSRAEIPFLDEQASKITNTHVRTGTLLRCMIVPVSTENCLRQSRHFHTRRSDGAPVLVLRERPLAGVRK